MGALGGGLRAGAGAGVVSSSPATVIAAGG